MRQESAAIEATSERPDAAHCTHAVLFYEDDEYLIERLTTYFGDALEANQAAVVVACASHLNALEARLIDRGINLEEAAHDNRYLKLEVDETLERFMRDGAPDASLFFAIFDEVLRRAGGAQTDATRDILVFG